MADLDLDIISNKKKTIKLFGKEILLKNVEMQQHLLNEYFLEQLEKIQMVDEEAIKEASNHIAEYLTRIMEITPEDAGKVTTEQFQAIRTFMERKQMYDQGYNDREIDLLEKKRIKKLVAQMK